MIDDDILKHFTQASADEGFRDAALKELVREAEAKIAAIAGGTFPAGAGETVRPTEKSEWSPMTPENVARMNELLAIDAAKTELRRVAMVLHAVARDICEIQFEKPSDVSYALTRLAVAFHAIEDSRHSSIVINALNLENK